MQKILIVEDDIDIQDILKNHLIDADFAALYSSALPTYSSFLSLENASILSALRCS